MAGWRGCSIKATGAESQRTLANRQNFRAAARRMAPLLVALAFSSPPGRGAIHLARKRAAGAGGRPGDDEIALDSLCERQISAYGRPGASIWQRVILSLKHALTCRHRVLKGHLPSGAEQWMGTCPGSRGQPPATACPPLLASYNKRTQLEISTCLSQDNDATALPAPLGVPSRTRSTAPDVQHFLGGVVVDLLSGYEPAHTPPHHHPRSIPTLRALTPACRYQSTPPPPSPPLPPPPARCATSCHQEGRQDEGRKEGGSRLLRV